MDTSYPWVQFIGWLTAGSVVYGIIVVAKFYPYLLRRLAFWSSTPKPSTPSERYSEYAPDNIMGAIRPSNYVLKATCSERTTYGQKPALDAPLPITPTSDKPVQVATKKIVGEEEEEEVVIEMDLQSLPTPDESPISSGVDMDQLSQLIDETASIVSNHASHGDTPEAEIAKSQLMAFIAADYSLTTSDFARQIASTLDQEVPTASYSGLDTLQTIAA